MTTVAAASCHGTGPTSAIRTAPSDPPANAPATDMLMAASTVAPPARSARSTRARPADRRTTTRPVTTPAATGTASVNQPTTPRPSVGNAPNTGNAGTSPRSTPVGATDVSAPTAKPGPRANAPAHTIIVGR